MNTETTFKPIFTIHVDSAQERVCDPLNPAGESCPVPPKGSLISTIALPTSYYREIGKWEEVKEKDTSVTQIMQNPKQNYGAYELFCCSTKFGTFLPDSYSVVFNGYPVDAKGQYISKEDGEYSEDVPGSRIQLYAELYQNDQPVDAKKVPSQDAENFKRCMLLCRQTEGLALLYHPDFEYLSRNDLRLSPGWIRSILPNINPEMLQIAPPHNSNFLPEDTVHGSWAIRFYYIQGMLFAKFESSVQYRILYSQVYRKLRGYLKSLAHQHVLLLSPDDKKLIQQKLDLHDPTQSSDSPLLQSLSINKFYSSNTDLLREMMGLKHYRTIKHTPMESTSVDLQTILQFDDGSAFDSLKQILHQLLPSCVITTLQPNPELQRGATIGVRGYLVIRIITNSIEDLALINLIKQELSQLYKWEFLTKNPLCMITPEYQDLQIKYYRGVFLIPKERKDNQPANTDQLSYRMESRILSLRRQGIFTITVSADSPEIKGIEFLSKNFDTPILDSKKITNSTTIFFLRSLIFDPAWFRRSLFDYMDQGQALVLVSPRDGVPFKKISFGSNTKVLSDGRFAILATSLDQVIKMIAPIGPYLIG